jgi:Protein of unknown function (DUF2892)
MLHHNVGGLDRVLRLTLGGILFLGGLVLLTGRTGLGVTLVVVGLLALLTGIIRFCLLYIPLGLSTTRPEGQRLNQVCDCAAWMRARPNNRASGSSAAQEAEVSKPVTAANGR